MQISRVRKLDLNSIKGCNLIKTMKDDQDGNFLLESKDLNFSKDTSFLAVDLPRDEYTYNITDYPAATIYETFTNVLLIKNANSHHVAYTDNKNIIKIINNSKEQLCAFSVNNNKGFVIDIDTREVKDFEDIFYVGVYELGKTLIGYQDYVSYSPTEKSLKIKNPNEEIWSFKSITLNVFEFYLFDQSKDTLTRKKLKMHFDERKMSYAKIHNEKTKVYSRFLKECYQTDTYEKRWCFYSEKNFVIILKLNDTITKLAIIPIKENSPIDWKIVKTNDLENKIGGRLHIENYDKITGDLSVLYYNPKLSSLFSTNFTLSFDDSSFSEQIKSMSQYKSRTTGTTRSTKAATLSAINKSLNEKLVNTLSELADFLGNIQMISDDDLSNKQFTDFSSILKKNFPHNEYSTIILTEEDKGRFSYIVTDYQNISFQHWILISIDYVILVYLGYKYESNISFSLMALEIIKFVVEVLETRGPFTMSDISENSKKLFCDTLFSRIENILNRTINENSDFEGNSFIISQEKPQEYVNDQGFVKCFYLFIKKMLLEDTSSNISNDDEFLTEVNVKYVWDEDKDYSRNFDYVYTELNISEALTMITAVLPKSIFTIDNYKPDPMMEYIYLNPINFIKESIIRIFTVAKFKKLIDFDDIDAKMFSTSIWRAATKNDNYYNGKLLLYWYLHLRYRQLELHIKPNNNSLTNELTKICQRLLYLFCSEIIQKKVSLENSAKFLNLQQNSNSDATNIENILNMLNLINHFTKLKTNIQEDDLPKLFTLYRLLKDDLVSFLYIELAPFTPIIYIISIQLSFYQEKNSKEYNIVKHFLLNNSESIEVQYLVSFHLMYDQDLQDNHNEQKVINDIEERVSKESAKSFLKIESELNTMNQKQIEEFSVEIDTLYTNGYVQKCYKVPGIREMIYASLVTYHYLCFFESIKTLLKYPFFIFDGEEYLLHDNLTKTYEMYLTLLRAKELSDYHNFTLFIYAFQKVNNQDIYSEIYTTQPDEEIISYVFKNTNKKPQFCFTRNQTNTKITHITFCIHEIYLDKIPFGEDWMTKLVYFYHQDPEYMQQIIDFTKFKLSIKDLTLDVPMKDITTINEYVSKSLDYIPEESTQTISNKIIRKFKNLKDMVDIVMNEFFFAAYFKIAKRNVPEVGFENSIDSTVAYLSTFFCDLQNNANGVTSIINEFQCIYQKLYSFIAEAHIGAQDKTEITRFFLEITDINNWKASDGPRTTFLQLSVGKLIFLDEKINSLISVTSQPSQELIKDGYKKWIAAWLSSTNNYDFGLTAEELKSWKTNGMVTEDMLDKVLPQFENRFFKNIPFLSNANLEVTVNELETYTSIGLVSEYKKDFGSVKSTDALSDDILEMEAFILDAETKAKDNISANQISEILEQIENRSSKNDSNATRYQQLFQNILSNYINLLKTKLNNETFIKTMNLNIIKPTKYLEYIQGFQVLTPVILMTINVMGNIKARQGQSETEINKKWEIANDSIQKTIPDTLYEFQLLKAILVDINGTKIEKTNLEKQLFAMKTLEAFIDWSDITTFTKFAENSLNLLNTLGFRDEKDSFMENFLKTIDQKLVDLRNTIIDHPTEKTLRDSFKTLKRYLELNKSVFQITNRTTLALIDELTKINEVDTLLFETESPNKDNIQNILKEFDSKFHYQNLIKYLKSEASKLQDPDSDLQEYILHITDDIIKCNSTDCRINIIDKVMNSKFLNEKLLRDVLYDNIKKHIVQLIKDSQTAYDNNTWRINTLAYLKKIGDFKYPFSKREKTFESLVQIYSDLKDNAPDGEKILNLQEKFDNLPKIDEADSLSSFSQQIQTELSKKDVVKELIAKYEKMIHDAGTGSVKKFFDLLKDYKADSSKVINSGKLETNQITVLERQPSHFIIGFYLNLAEKLKDNINQPGEILKVLGEVINEGEKLVGELDKHLQYTKISEFFNTTLPSIKTKEDVQQCRLIVQNDINYAIYKGLKSPLEDKLYKIEKNLIAPVAPAKDINELIQEFEEKVQIVKYNESWIPLFEDTFKKGKKFDEKKLKQSLLTKCAIIDEKIKGFIENHGREKILRNNIKAYHSFYQQTFGKNNQNQPLMSQIISFYDEVDINDQYFKEYYENSIKPVENILQKDYPNTLKILKETYINSLSVKYDQKLIHKLDYLMSKVTLLDEMESKVPKEFFENQVATYKKYLRNYLDNFVALMFVNLTAEDLKKSFNDLLDIKYAKDLRDLDIVQQFKQGIRALNPTTHFLNSTNEDDQFGYLKDIQFDLQFITDETLRKNFQIVIRNEIRIKTEEVFEWLFDSNELLNDQQKSIGFLNDAIKMINSKLVMDILIDLSKKLIKRFLNTTPNENLVRYFKKLSPYFSKITEADFKERYDAVVSYYEHILPNKHEDLIGMLTLEELSPVYFHLQNMVNFFYEVDDDETQTLFKQILASDKVYLEIFKMEPEEIYQIYLKMTRVADVMDKITELQNKTNKELPRKLKLYIDKINIHISDVNGYVSSIQITEDTIKDDLIRLKTKFFKDLTEKDKEELFGLYYLTQVFRFEQQQQDYGEKQFLADAQKYLSE